MDKHRNPKKWKQENKDRVNFSNRKRDRLKKCSEGSHTLSEWQKLKEKYNYLCLCCKKQEPFIKLTEDHIVPLSLGGTDYIENIQPLCLSCNDRKWIKVINYIKGISYEELRIY